MSAYSLEGIQNRINWSEDDKWSIHCVAIMMHKSSGKIWSDSVVQLKEQEKTCRQKVDEIGEENGGK